MAVGGLIAGAWRLALAIVNEPPIVTGHRIAVQGLSPERPSCSSCHLENGAGQPDVGIPRLAGLTSSYIAAQLEYFATGARYDSAMYHYAAILTPVQRQAVADYFASLPVPEQPDLPKASAATLDQGRALFLDGDYRTGLLACSDCHGSTGLGVGDFSPRLAGQSADYIAEELQQWQSGDLRDPQGSFMRAEASHLSQTEIADLATFVSWLQRKEAGKP